MANIEVRCKCEEIVDVTKLTQENKRKCPDCGSPYAIRFTTSQAPKGTK